VTYIVPIFAVIFGVLLLSESISWHEPVGGVLILAGVTLANRPRAAPTLAQSAA
jgi:drug/metabolite transporter (DMT)-like permease